MRWKLFLDRERFPKDTSWMIARSVNEAIDLIAKQGYPSEISLEYDFGENNPTGCDFLKIMSDEVMSGWPNLDFPQVELDCHSTDTECRCTVL